MDEKIGWITNCWKDDVKENISALILGRSGRIIAVGRPKASEFRTAEELEMGGMVGLYDVAPGSDVAGLPNIYTAPKPLRANFP